MGKHKEKSKKHKHEKKRNEHKKKHRSLRSSSSSSSSDEWIEKDALSEKESSPRKDVKDASNTKITASYNRDEWMSLSTSFATESNIDRRKERENNKRMEREHEQYNPRENVRELNPYWKDGGEGLPKFKKPSEEDGTKKYESINKPKLSSSWRKKNADSNQQAPVDEKSVSQSQQTNVLSDKDINMLASKLVKAEIMGKTELVKELKKKLEDAQKHRANSSQQEDVILTQTDSQGHVRPVKLQSDFGEFSGGQTKKRKVETHQDKQRMRYFADDDKHSLQQMFENEKYITSGDQNKEFLKMTSKVRRMDDLDDVFTDNIRKKQSDSKTDKKHVDRAISEHQKITKSVDSCKRCIQSDVMLKHLMVSLGETVFLSLPAHEPLTEGHCVITPVRHVTCSTLLDENEWAEIINIRRALTRMFNSQNEDVIFFEMAKNLERYPHMYIECIPLNKEEGEMAPIYFKKAIDECEAEWAQNKKLVSLKGRDVRKAIPKGLPYFFVSFGMEEGFAHVVEDEKTFPNNFAQEIIGGMLDLHHSKWRKPRQQSFEEQSRRVVKFSNEWESFDCSKT